MTIPEASPEITPETAAAEPVIAPAAPAVPVTEPEPAAIAAEAVPEPAAEAAPEANAPIEAPVEVLTEDITAAEQTILTEVAAADTAPDEDLATHTALLVAAHNSLIAPEDLTDADYRAAIEYAATTAVVQAAAEAAHQHPLAIYDPSFILASGQTAGVDQAST